MCTTGGHIPSRSTTAQSDHQAISTYPSHFGTIEAGFPITTFNNSLLTSKELEGSLGQSNVNHHPSPCTRKLLLWIRKMQGLSNTSDHKYIRYPYDWRAHHNLHHSLLQILLIMCRRCGQQYVGETGQSLHFRINSHRHNIMHKNIISTMH